MEKKVESKSDEKPLISYSDTEEVQIPTAVTFDNCDEESDEEILIGAENKGITSDELLIDFKNKTHVESESPIVPIVRDY